MPIIDVHVAAGTFVDRVGEQTGSALHRFALEEAAAAMLPSRAGRSERC